MKKRISLTIDNDILKRLDELVDEINTRSRSEAIESIVRNHLKGNKTAVFLGGGNLESLKIDDEFKPLIKISGKSLIEYNMSELKKNGFSKIFFIGKSELIGECFKIVGDGENFGVDVTYIEEKKTLGNAKTLQLIQNHVNQPFLVLPVDNYFSFDLGGMVKRHMSETPLATLAVQASRGYSTELGIVEMAGDKIINYEEKPNNPKTFLTALFIGIYSPEIFDYIPKGDLKWILQRDIFPKIIHEKDLNGYIISGISVNIDSKKDIQIIKNLLK
ncbi:MAG: ribbon-helix-helix protein, CopG family [Candidatus Aenigmarchaeota archaeon]|nr:ribbon-helix-helix protein, CopG family [Candidatus Aenigmarchaeota archaeon]